MVKAIGVGMGVGKGPALLLCCLNFLMCWKLNPTFTLLASLAGA